MKRIVSIAVIVTSSIAIAIIGILIAVGVTGWKAAVKTANEAAAIKSLTTIAEQQTLYYKTHGRISFGTFDEMLKEGLLDNRFDGTTPVVEGYVYSMRVIPKSTTGRAGFAVNADPLVTEGFSASGKNHFYLDSYSNTIHVNSTQPATANDPPIGQ
jgi:type II secretory pathway pseudopilin PulG